MVSTNRLIRMQMEKPMKPNDDQWKPGIVEDPDFKNGGCNHPQHLPPMHIVIPQGKMLNHECPACKHRTTVRPPYISF